MIFLSYIGDAQCGKISSNRAGCDFHEPQSRSKITGIQVKNLNRMRFWNVVLNLLENLRVKTFRIRMRINN